MTETIDKTLRPTAGENSLAALDSFESMTCTKSRLRDESQTQLEEAAVGLLDACIRLHHQLPDGERKQLISILPLTAGEQRRVREPEWLGDPVLKAEILRKITRWAVEPPVEIEDRQVHPASFLNWLEPTLDRSDDRRRAKRLRFRILNPASPYSEDSTDAEFLYD